MKAIKCVCGYVARGETDDDVIDEIDSHVRQDHPDLVGKITREEMLGWIEET